MNRVVTLLALAPPDGTTRFVDQVVRGAPDDVGFVYFSWPRALLGRYDVLHVHWPEFLLRARSRRGRAARSALLVALVARLRLTRTPVVRTLHNLAPHTPGTRAEALLLGLLDRRVAHRVVLNPLTPTPAGEPVTHVPHGHYRDVLPAPAGAGRPGAAVFAGRIEPYKNVDALLRVFASLPDRGLRLRVVGQADPPTRRDLEALAATDPRVGLRFGFVPDADLAAEVGAASLVVLPYAELHNSGVLLVALSLNRPVLVPRTPTTDQLAQEVGEAWVRRFDGTLTPTDLVAALAEAPVVAQGPPPRLEGRDWGSVAAAYADVYRRTYADATRRLRPPGPRPPGAGRPTRVYVYPSGQRSNLGDSVLRRAYLDALRPHGRLHVCVGTDQGAAGATDGYVDGLGLRPGDVVHRSRARWLASALLAWPHARVVTALNAGELVAGTRFALTVPSKLALVVAARLSGGRAVAAGVGVRAPQGEGPGRFLRALLTAQDVLTWRDPASRGWAGRGTVAPDWAFALGTPVPELREDRTRRDVVAVCLRGDRPRPDASWVAAVRELARRHDAGIVVVTQVVADEDRAAELADRLGATRLSWSGGPHAEHEREVRAVYRRSVAVVSDRIHALILGLTEGAVPVGLTTGSAEKVARTFAGVTELRIAWSAGDEDLDPAATVERIEALVAARETLLNDLAGARDELWWLGQELGAPTGSGRRRSRAVRPRSTATSRRTGRTNVPTAAR